MPEINLVQRFPFAQFYFFVFTGSSFTTHASITAVSRVVIGSAPRLLVGMPDQLGAGEGVYGQSLALLGITLLVASRAMGYPRESDVIDALNTE